MTLSPSQQKEIDRSVASLVRRFEVNEEATRSRVMSRINDERDNVSGALRDIVETIISESTEPKIREAAQALSTSSAYKIEEAERLIKMKLTEWTAHHRTTFVEILGTIVQFLRDHEQSITSNDGPATPAYESTGSYTGRGATAGGGHHVVRSGKTMS